MLVSVSGLASILPPSYTTVVGSLDGVRVLEIVHVYITAFFDFVLRGKESELLEGPSTDYPEVESIA